MVRRSPVLVVLLCASVLFAACAGTVPKGADPSETVAPQGGYVEEGLASWYGKDLQGRKTASGDIFDLNGLSAAHRLLPFGTRLLVTNLGTQQSVTVVVNDRGPFGEDRMLELSYAAARALGFLVQGAAQVKIESLQPIADGGEFTVQAANYAEEKSARALKDRLSKKFGNISILPFETNRGTFYRVRVGAYPSLEKAEIVAGRLALEGVEPLVLRKD
ncbi:MAG: hypothetical protein A2072_05695 [Nitrospirae bacterium GWC1_57_7]|nr:MAG: hypothetical protein A2072_05695 [Nitrospirae bacterium GWC1_57_7]